MVCNSTAHPNNIQCKGDKVDGSFLNRSSSWRRSKGRRLMTYENKTRTKSNGNAKSARKTAVLRGLLVFSPQPSSFRVKPGEPDMAEKSMPKIGVRVWQSVKNVTP
jgi:hypothetical protein